MKKIVAKICILILGKLGYNNTYSPNNVITINVDASEAIKNLKLLNKQIQDLKDKL